jgi:hypothetical protein
LVESSQGAVILVKMAHFMTFSDQIEVETISLSTVFSHFGITNLGKKMILIILFTVFVLFLFYFLKARLIEHKTITGYESDEESVDAHIVLSCEQDIDVRVLTDEDYELEISEDEIEVTNDGEVKNCPQNVNFEDSSSEEEVHKDDVFDGDLSEHVEVPQILDLVESKEVETTVNAEKVENNLLDAMGGIDDKCEVDFENVDDDEDDDKTEVDFENVDDEVGSKIEVANDEEVLTSKMEIEVENSTNKIEKCSVEEIIENENVVENAIAAYKIESDFPVTEVDVVSGGEVELDDGKNEQTQFESDVSLVSNKTEKQARFVGENITKVQKRAKFDEMILCENIPLVETSRKLYTYRERCVFSGRNDDPGVRSDDESYLEEAGDVSLLFDEAELRREMGFQFGTVGRWKEVDAGLILDVSTEAECEFDDRSISGGKCEIGSGVEFGQDKDVGEIGNKIGRQVIRRSKSYSIIGESSDVDESESKFGESKCIVGGIKSNVTESKIGETKSKISEIKSKISESKIGESKSKISESKGKISESKSKIGTNSNVGLVYTEISNMINETWKAGSNFGKFRPSSRKPLEGGTRMHSAVRTVYISGSSVLIMLTQ